MCITYPEELSRESNLLLAWRTVTATNNCNRRDIFMMSAHFTTH